MTGNVAAPTRRQVNFPDAAKTINAVLSNDASEPSAIYRAVFAAKTLGSNTFTESSANAATVTINGTTAQAGDGRISVSASTGMPFPLGRSLAAHAMFLASMPKAAVKKRRQARAAAVAAARATPTSPPTSKAGQSSPAADMTF